MRYTVDVGHGEEDKSWSLVAIRLVEIKNIVHRETNDCKTYALDYFDPFLVLWCVSCFFEGRQFLCVIN